jgi:DNA-binding NarL/FixJ family response regulator
VGSRIRIMIADDHPLVRSGLRALLERDGEFQVIAEAADG